MFKKNRLNYKKLFWYLIVIALVLAFTSYYVSTTLNSDLIVSFIDVGQGDSIYIKTPNGEDVILDGGDTGSGKVLESFFRKSGISDIEDAIVSHYHNDHAEGIYEIMGEIPINNLYLSDTKRLPELNEKLYEKAKKNGININYVSKGDKLSIGKDVEFNVLFPNNNIFKNNDNNLNNDSIVLKLKYNDTEFLFTGDLEADAERTLVGQEDLSADVLKVGHHGSRTSTSLEFFKAVSPKYAVIQVGKDNKFGHPNPQTLMLLNDSKVPAIRTDLDGTITFRVNKYGIKSISTSRHR